jgi:hypothetical protein
VVATEDYYLKGLHCIAIYNKRIDNLNRDIKEAELVN